MATISITSDELNANNLKAIKTFLKTLKIKFEIANDFEIPQSHKDLVLDRVKKSKSKKLLNWDDVKDDFDGI